MEIQLDKLIEKIKKEGIEQAKAEAAKIKSEAEASASAIVKEAKDKADAIIVGAEEEAKRSEKAGIAALEQASRNLVLSFKGEIQGLLDLLTKKAVASSYSLDVVKDVLPKLISNWGSMNTDSLTVLLSEDDLKILDQAFVTGLQSSLKEGVELKGVKKLDKGFHIMEKDGGAFYDFSAESVANMLSAYLNPKLSEILKGTEAV